MKIIGAFSSLVLMQVTYGNLAEEKARTVLINGAWKKAAGQCLQQNHFCHDMILHDICCHGMQSAGNCIFDKLILPVNSASVVKMLFILKGTALFYNLTAVLSNFLLILVQYLVYRLKNASPLHLSVHK